MNLKEASAAMERQFKSLGLDDIINPRGLSAAIRRGELKYIEGTKTLDPAVVEAFGRVCAKDRWIDIAYSVVCEPMDFPTEAEYLAECAEIKKEMLSTGLFTEAEVEGHTKPFTRA